RHVVFVGHEIDQAAGFIDNRMAVGARPETSGAGDCPCATRQLLELLPGKIVEIVVTKARALAGPKEALVIREKIEVVGKINPAFVGIREDGLASGRPGVTEEQIEAGLSAI